MPLPPSSTSHQTNGNGNGHGPLKQVFVPTMAPPSLVDKTEDADLGRLVGVLKRRMGVFLGVATLSFGGLTFWYLTRPPAYTGSVNLLVEPVTNVTPAGLETVVGGKTATGLDYDSQIRVLRGPAVINPILEKIQTRYPNITYNSLLNRLSIIQEGDSKVLRIMYHDADPEVVSFVLTEVIQGFVDYSVQDRQGDLRRGLTFLDEQLKEKWQEVADIESDLSDFQKRYDLVDVNATSGSVTERLNQMLADQEQLRVQLAALGPLYDNLQDQVGFDPNTAIRVANLNESPTYQARLGDLRELEQNIAAERARFQADTPMIEALEDQRQQLLPLLEAEAQRVVDGSIEAEDADNLGYQGTVSRGLMQQLVDTANQIQVLQTQDQAISQAVQQLQAEIQRLADLSRSFQEIDRQRTVAENSLNQLLASRQELRLQMARQASPWEIISPLNESGITKTTNLPRKLLLSSVVGLMLGGVAALVRDRVDQAFKSVDELVKETQLPNLATVPNAPALQKQPLLMVPDLAATMADVLTQNQSPDRLYTSFSFAEAFYSLEANLRMLSSDTPIQVVALTSSVPGEGKSTMCAHLAIAAANMGRRVLLIDGDLRKPSLHLVFSQSNRQGLSDLLTQTIDDPNSLVHALPGNPNLHLLTAGQRPPAPGRLLSSRKMQQITEQYRRHYDLVIFDTPPLAGMIDAKLTAAHADGLLLVVRLHRSERSEIQRVLADLGNTAQAPLLGLVVNGVPQSRQSHYDDYYGYYGRHQVGAGLEDNG